MSAPWWGKDVTSSSGTGVVSASSVPAGQPVLVRTKRDSVLQELAERIPNYTPEWTNRRAGEAGDAVARLFSEEMEPVLQRVNELPDKAYVEFLIAGGIQPLPPTPAQAVLKFTVADAAPQSVSVPQGFQVGAGPAPGGGQVIFETNANLSAAPGKIQEIYALEKGFYNAIDPSKDDIPFYPFGAKPKPGNALFVGIQTGADTILSPQLSLGIQVQGPAGQPPPVSSGGAVPLPAPLAPLLQWAVLDGPNVQPLAVISDETGGLLRSGVVTLALPDQWRPAIPQGAPDSVPLRWLRLQIAYGAYPNPPVLLSVNLNMVRATAVQTFHKEVLTPVPDAGGSVLAVSHTPVLPGTLDLVVDDTADLSFTPGQADSSAGPRKWKEVDDLAQWPADAEVFVLDPGTGQVTFGDGVHGKALPAGFRNVTARSYQVGGGAAGAVDVNKITGPILSIPFISGVTNPWPASGGMDAESDAQAKLLGPREIRARGRAVTTADYEILALRSTGARVARAHAVSGLHPLFPGVPIPGVVCVFVVPVERGIGPPVPDGETLRGVSTYLSATLAPAGVEVVAAAPVYARVRVETTVVVASGASRGDAVRDVLKLLDSYLDPVTGGDDGQGWPFGRMLSYASFVRKLLAVVPGITAVPRLAFVVDGVRGPTCSDFPLAPNSLVWPAEHQVLAVAPGEEQ